MLIKTQLGKKDKSMKPEVEERDIFDGIMPGELLCYDSRLEEDKLSDRTKVRDVAAIKSEEVRSKR